MSVYFSALYILIRLILIAWWIVNKVWNTSTAQQLLILSFHPGFFQCFFPTCHCYSQAVSSHFWHSTKTKNNIVRACQYWLPQLYSNNENLKYVPDSNISVWIFSNDKYHWKEVSGHILSSICFQEFWWFSHQSCISSKDSQLAQYCKPATWFPQS